MKAPVTHPLVIGSFGLALGIVLTGCVDPYYSQNPGRPQSVTSYSVGYEVQSLPPGYRTEVIDGNNYYNYNGTYYRPRSGRYVVVETPRRYEEPRSRYTRPDGRRDVIITQLPSGYRRVEHRGVRYYQVNDTYYQQRGSGYITVRSPY